MVTAKELGALTIKALYNHSIKNFGDCKSFGFAMGDAMTYAEFSVFCDQFKSLLYALGIEKGQKVAILSNSMPNWGASFFAIERLGAIAVPLLPDFSPTEVETILKHADVAGIFVSEKLFPKVENLDDATAPFIVKLDSIELVRGKKTRSESDVIVDVEVLEDDTASIIYTSGTTGRSKGVELSHKNLVFDAVQCQYLQRIHKRDKTLSFLPLSHVYEFTLGLLLMVMNGAAIYYLEKPPTVTSLLPALAKVRPTFVLSVPAVVEKIYKNKIIPTFTKNERITKIYANPICKKILHRIAGISLKKTFGGRLKFFGIGGAKVDPEVEQFLKDAKFPYSIGYGLTETAPVLAGSMPNETIPGTVGGFLPGVELKILDPNPKTGIGEVVAKGDNIMKGYYKEPEMTAAVFTTKEDSVGEGWFKTGDLGSIETRRGKPWLSLKGRLKNVILSATGENIYPEDIEFVLNQHPLVSESLVVEEDSGLVALVQLNEEKMQEKFDAKKMIDSAMQAASETVHNLTEDFLYMQEDILTEIKFFVNEQVNRFSSVGRVRSVPEFEKTASQKIKRHVYGSQKKDHNSVDQGHTVEHIENTENKE